VFSKLDLKKGYHQVPVHPDDVAKTAVITPFGLFEYIRMPFGMRNAGQTFQRLMDKILAGLQHSFVYLDDILVASKNHQEHVEHLREVFQRLQANGLVLNQKKCLFAVSALDFLGHRVSAEGIAPLSNRVAAVKNFPQPKTVKQLQSFLGMINFYRRFIPGPAKISRQLADTLKGSQKKQVEWKQDMAAAFLDIKTALCSSTLLAHPDSKRSVHLAVDGSDSHVGAVLQQESEKGPQPLAFFSKKLNSTQQRYSTFDRELLACYEAVRHFRWLLEGRRFFILSDHKPLSFALSKAADAWSARQQRQLSYVAEYTSDIRHVPGKDNVVADLLSWPAACIASVPPYSGEQLSYVQLAAELSTCETVAELVSSPSLHVQT
jgi:hypothetical protein